MMPGLDFVAIGELMGEDKGMMGVPACSGFGGPNGEEGWEVGGRYYACGRQSHYLTGPPQCRLA